MADPLSIGSAVVGLISASARIALVLHHFIVRTRDAPKSASQILDEINSISAALEQLQIYLIGASKANAARRPLLSLHNIVATLTACVTTYSDLERVVGNESMQEAESSMHRLIALVEDVVANNSDLKHRLDALAADHASLPPPSHLRLAEPSSPPAPPSERSFEADLNKSRVYRNLRGRDSIYSISSSQRASLALSAFSDLSLGNISVISVLCLPVWSADLSNAEHYRFGREGLTLSLTELAERYPHIEFPDVDAFEAETGSTQDDMSEQGEDPDAEILFLAASLFEFHVSFSKREGGFPYLEYVPGEIFKVIGLKGELWLARNEDDPTCTVGWIWEKHFAKIYPEDA
ncbi:hypothetical protein N0V90_003939 [Kalmusia sp. IMI 367209]|nr:hypothetical protein N0V90_003939 [Kalmusia sp. IMI 367209]